MLDKFVYLVAEGNLKKYKDGWSKWRTLEEHKKKIKVPANYETIIPTKLVLETDYPKPETNKQVMLHTKKLLDKQGMGYKIFFTGSKSYHIELIFEELANIPFEKRPKAKALLAKAITNEELAKDFDEANFGNKRMLQIPGMPHRKTRTIKTLVYQKEGYNKIPQSVFEELNRIEIKSPKNYDTYSKKNCPFLEYCLENKVDLQNKQQNKNFSPNAFAYFRGNENLLERLVKTQDQENLTVARLQCWGQYKPELNCKQVQAFAGSIGKRSICDICLLEGK